MYPTIDSVDISAGIGPFLIYIDTVMHHLFFPLILIGVWVIITFSIFAKSGDFTSGAAAAGLTEAVIAILMRLPTPKWITGYILAFALLWATVWILIFLFSNKE